MLKKLVKYGNSNALILDRSILALLDIKEGATVKLRIEGDTLTIKAAENIKPTESLMTAVENIDEKIGAVTDNKGPMLEKLTQDTREFVSKVEEDPSSMELLKAWAPGTKNYQKLEEAFGKIMKKYQDQLALLSTEEFQKEAHDLKNKYQNQGDRDQYRKELIALRAQFAPGLAAMDQEMQQAAKDLGYPEQFSVPM